MLTQPAGWLPEVVGVAMREQLLALRPKCAVEIGVYGGQSLCLIATALRDGGGGLVWGVDPWSATAAEEGFAGGPMEDWAAKTGLTAQHDMAMWHLTNKGLWRWTRVVTARSQDVPHLFGERQIEWLHIDGNHSDAMAYLDVQFYCQSRLAHGAPVWIDDIGHASDFRTMILARELMDYQRTVDRYVEFRGR